MAARLNLRLRRLVSTCLLSISERPPSMRALALVSPPPVKSMRLPLSRRNTSVCRNVFQFRVSCQAWSQRYFSIQAFVDPSSGNLVEVPLAQTGEGIAECELLKWFVKEGDSVDQFQPLCEVQSDKATIEITSRFKGEVKQILYFPGDIVKVGETMLKILINETEGPLISQNGGSVASSNLQLNQSEPEASLNNQRILGGVLVTPSVRHLAKQYGININDISGSGKDGRVLKEDVLNYTVRKDIVKELPFLSPACDENADSFQNREAGYMAFMQRGNYEDKVLPIRGFKRSMIKSMSMAAKVPHFYYVEEIKCNALVKLKVAFQNANTDPEVKHTFLPFLVKSLSMTLDKYPLMNSSFNEDSNEITLKGCHNIGVAMDTSFGLVVPTIKKVQSLSILEVTKELARLQQLAVSNKLNAEDISWGTITITNIGSIGGKFGSPILNLPEASIIAIGKIQKLPRFAEDDSVYPAYVANVAIGADHRIVDGATVARFCNEWKALIENPDLLLLHMR